MPPALRIFIWSLLAALVAGYVSLRVGFWLVERFFPREPLAFVVVLCATAGVAVASAVTTGVLIGKGRDKP